MATRGHALPDMLKQLDRPSIGDQVILKHADDLLAFIRNVAYVVDQDSSKGLKKCRFFADRIHHEVDDQFSRVEAKQDLNERIEITNEDLDKEKGIGSASSSWCVLSRADLLHIALMSSGKSRSLSLGGGITRWFAGVRERDECESTTIRYERYHYVDSSGLSSKKRGERT